MNQPKLKLLPRQKYADVAADDPIRLYYWPIFGPLYRRRVELCLGECRGGGSVLEVGCGAGVTFLNLHEFYQEIHGLDLSTRVDEVTAFFRGLNVPVYLKNGNVLDLPYPDDSFDTVLSISVLEHLKPEEQFRAFTEICRVLKPGGQAVYGVPVDRPLMSLIFRVMGYNIRDYHFSTEKEVFAAASGKLSLLRLQRMKNILGPVYEVGHFVKPGLIPKTETV